MSASLFLPNGVQTINNQPEISRYYNLSGQPYLDTAQVVTEVTGRYVGQTFNVGGVEYWFKDGILDTDLVIKISEYIPFTPSDYDLEQFTNESADPFVRESEVPPAETTASIQAKRPLKTVNSQSLEGSGDVEIASVSSIQSGIVNNNSLQELGGVDKLINGIRIGRGNNNADGNTAIGFETLLLNSTGQSNTAIGSSVLRANTTGNSNVGVGNNALFLNTIGLNNMAVGDSALRSNTIGNRNSAIGDSSLRANTTGNSNVGVGNNSLSINTTGSNNVAIGQGAGQNITTGSNNTYIGQGTSLGNTSNTIVLASGTNNRLIINENGQIQITQPPTEGTTADALLVRNEDGSIRQIPTSAIGGAVSSVNGKTGVVVINKSDVGLSNVDNTSDLGKPISTATQTALNAKQNTLIAGANITIIGDTISASGGGSTNLSYTPSPTNGIVVSDTGTDATIPLADATNAGLLSPSEKLAIGRIPVQVMGFDYAVFNDSMNFFYNLEIGRGFYYYLLNINSILTTNINLVAIDDLSYFDKVLQTSILKRISFNADVLFGFQFTYEVGIYKADDIFGTNPVLIYNNTFTSDADFFLKVIDNVNISVEAGKFIHLFFRCIDNAQQGNTVRNFKLEFYV